MGISFSLNAYLGPQMVGIVNEIHDMNPTLAEISVQLRTMNESISNIMTCMKWAAYAGSLIAAILMARIVWRNTIDKEAQALKKLRGMYLQGKKKALNAKTYEKLDELFKMLESDNLHTEA